MQKKYISTNAPQRFEELDSLRGVAALIVVIYHCVLLLEIRPLWIQRTIASPLGLLTFGGPQAVILFFLLSGFVLYLPYTRSAVARPYSKFIIKRICRIYIPYLVATAFAVLVYRLSFRPHLPVGVSSLYGWKVMSAKDLLLSIGGHILFIGWPLDRGALNGVTWTLADEMRISFVFPWIALAVLRWKTRSALLVGLLVSCLVTVAIRVTHHGSPFETAHFAAIFLLGAVVASRWEALRDFWKAQGTAVRIFMLAVAYLACAYAKTVHDSYPTLLSSELADWIIGIGASVFLIAAMSGGPFARTLRHPALARLGTWSYGVYLLHLPILFVCVDWLWRRSPTPLAYLVMLPTTIIAAALFYRFVEQPSIALGKRLTASPGAPTPRGVGKATPSSTTARPTAVLTQV